jgi:hypothetical protein
VNTEHTIPPLRTLPSGHLAVRKQHLLAEIARDAQPRNSAPRQRRMRMQRPLLVAISALAALVVATSALAVGVTVFGLFGGTPVKETQFSPQGQFMLSSMGAPGPRGITLITSRDGSTFYRIQRADGESCWAAGDAGALAPSLAAAACPSGTVPLAFPSREQPILDFSQFVAHGSNGQPAARDQAVPVKIAGLAVDAVTQIRVEFANGTTATVPVDANAYVATDLPQKPVRQIVALDNNGGIIYSLCESKGC